jgi:hypothetical protein
MIGASWGLVVDSNPSGRGAAQLKAGTRRSRIMDLNGRGISSNAGAMATAQ